MTDPAKARQEPSGNRQFSRRALVTRLAGPFALAIPLSVLAIRRPAADEAPETEPPQATDDPSAFMARAWRMRELAIEMGDQGYGAAIVKHGRIVGQAPSRVVVNRDPTAHAEIEAIRDAARNLGTPDLGGCVLYSSSRACPMCEAAAFWANIANMRFGSTIADAGAPRLRHC